MSDPAPRIFVLSPATLSGARGRRILAGQSDAPFMATLAGAGRVPLGDVFAFISSLYYRGKRAYARRFGRRSSGPSVLVVTSSRGLLPDTEPVGLDDLEELASHDIDAGDARYVAALSSTARELDDSLGGQGQVVLLGSIASDKYVDPLSAVFGAKLLFPEAFIGRGDMSRGGLLLRCVAADEELTYLSAFDADRRGPRPPKLAPKARS